MRDRAGDRFAQKHDRGDIGRQKVHEAAAEMALEQAVAVEIGDLADKSSRQSLAGMIRSTGYWLPRKRRSAMPAVFGRCMKKRRGRGGDHTKPPFIACRPRCASAPACDRPLAVAALNRHWPALWLAARL